MFGGGRGGGLDPSQLDQMMQQMGIDMEEIDAEEVIIRTADEELVFTDADVQLMEAQGQETYQVVGSPETRARGETTPEAADESAADAGGIPDDDIDLVAQRTGASEDAARDALEATDGDLAAAVERLE